jgi:DNA recombination protein RmuC
LNIARTETIASSTNGQQELWRQAVDKGLLDPEKTQRVWIVSPTTCMATLNTMRAILKDARLREQTGAIRKELAELYKDIERLSERVGNLDRHFGQAAKDIEEIKISSDKAGKRARRLDAFDFEELALPIVPKVPE